MSSFPNQEETLKGTFTNKESEDNLRNDEDPFFQRRKQKQGQGPFDDKFGFEDFRKQFEEERKKMFFDADPFGGFPRGASPGRHEGQGSGSGSPRMGRASSTGFPFDNARAGFDSFANRRPMFSTMRRPAWDEEPFVGHTNPFHTNRERTHSGSSGGNCSTGEEHIIPIRIERSPQEKKAAAKACVENPQSHPPISTTPIPMPAPEGMEQDQEAEVSYNTNTSNNGKPQRSSTEEIRKTPSPNEKEKSRAHSAPPNAHVPNGKFVASANINIEPHPEHPQQQQQQKNASHSNPHPQATQFGGKCTKEKSPVPGDGNGSGRPIPIFVEGRGTPAGSAPNNGPRFSQPKASRPAEQREVTPPPAPPKKPTPPKDPMEKVADITSDVKELEKDVDKYEGGPSRSRKDKDYLFLDEMLTRNLIKLDVIETEGREDVRNARKDCIKFITSCISKLESKVPKPEEQPMEAENADVPTTQDNGSGDANETNSKTQQSEETPNDVKVAA